MNILFYCSEYPPYRTGGIGNVTRIVAERLSQRGHTVVVAGFYPDGNKGFKTYELKKGVHVYRYSLPWRANRCGQILFKLLRRYKLNTRWCQYEVNWIHSKINHLIMQHSINIIEIPDFMRLNMEATGSLCYKTFPVPTVLRIHGCATAVSESLGRAELQTIRANDESHFARCQAISSVSKFSLHDFCHRFPSMSSLSNVVLYNPVEDEFVEDADESVTADSTTIFFMGKVTRAKGCFALLDAFALIADAHPQWRLRIAGGGDIDMAKSRLPQKMLHRVDFLGYLSKADIARELHNCAFVCMPSFYENFSMAALEVMAKGKALIYTSTTSGAEVIRNGRDGLLVDPSNIDQIVMALECLINDRAQRQQFARNGLQRIKQCFCSSSIVPKMEKFYLDMI